MRRSAIAAMSYMLMLIKTLSYQLPQHLSQQFLIELNLLKDISNRLLQSSTSVDHRAALWLSAQDFQQYSHKNSKM